ncbi:MAG: alpha/beta hydrolase [Pseudolabrys sp.]|nr:alpha/beta hydrolase [Pseudolabrys sp.]
MPATTEPSKIEHAFVETPFGRIHAAICGQGFPLLLLHQTPRSWREFEYVIPLLSGHFRTISIDTLGFGESDPIDRDKASIEVWAQASLACLNALGIRDFAVAGHHTGAVIAVEIAALSPRQVRALVLSGCPMVDAERRARPHVKGGIDDVEPRPDGGHLVDLWTRRQPFYPEGDTLLLQRFIIDALRAGPMAAAGHHVVGHYRMEDRLGAVQSPTLIIDPVKDPHVHPAAAKLARAIANSTIRPVAEGMVPLPEQLPGEFAAPIIDFVRPLVAR